MKTSVPALVVVAALASPAAAQYVSMDRQSDKSRVGVRLDFGFPDDSDDADAYFRTEVHGQFAVAGYGAYLSFPFVRDIVSEGPRKEVTAIGNVEVGGYKTFGSRMVDLVLRVGLSLPTAEDSIAEFSRGTLASYARLTDLVNARPDTFGVRLSASPDISFGIVFIRADVGADLAFDTSGDERRDGFQGQLRANVGGGVNAGLFAVTLEIVNLIGISGDALPFGNDSAHTIAASAWLHVLFLRPYVAFTFPLDEKSRAAYGHAFSFGAEAVF